MKGLKSDEYVQLRERWENWKEAGFPGIDKGLADLLIEFNDVLGVISTYSCIGHPGTVGSTPYISFGFLGGTRGDRIIKEILPEVFISGILTLELSLQISPFSTEDYIMAEDQLDETIPVMTLRCISMTGDMEQDETIKELFISNIQSIAMKLTAAFTS